MDLHAQNFRGRPDPELMEALQHLSRLNRIFGAARPVLHGVRRLWLAEGKPKQLTILDAGSGSGDINRTLLAWAERMRLDMRIILSDVTEEAQIEARRLFSGNPRVEFVRRSLFDLPARYADIVTASQFAHHFPQEELPGVVLRMLEVSRRGIVLSDIHRHWLPWAAVWMVTRLVSRNRYVRHDGPLSVAKGFRRADWDQLSAALGLPMLDVRWRPLFRWVLMLRKPHEPAGGLTHGRSG
jgi:2-polyprenyl-3-methyl-5-hydroxy-6-metoxy-1,4-benzoquinol methylase